MAKSKMVQLDSYFELGQAKYARIIQILLIHQDVTRVQDISYF